MIKDNKWTKVYSISPAFFSITRKCLLDDIIISLVRLFEKKNRSDYNIERYLDSLKIVFIKNNEILQKIDSFTQNINSKYHLISNLLTWRDKAIAHSDKEYFISKSDLPVDAPLNFEEIDSLLNDSFGFLNMISYEIDQSTQYPRYVNHADYDMLLRLIDNHLRNEQLKKSKNGIDV